jgi:hypothetical protein
MSDGLSGEGSKKNKKSLKSGIFYKNNNETR